jgi:hypothetical protein
MFKDLVTEASLMPSRKLVPQGCSRERAFLRSCCPAGGNRQHRSDDEWPDAAHHESSNEHSHDYPQIPGYNHMGTMSGIKEPTGY